MSSRARHMRSRYVLWVTALLTVLWVGAAKETSPPGKFIVLQEGSRVGSHYVEELLQKCQEIWMPQTGRDWMVETTTEILTHMPKRFAGHPDTLLKHVHTYWEGLSKEDGNGTAVPFRLFGFRTAVSPFYSKPLYAFMKRSLNYRRTSLSSKDAVLFPRILFLRRRQRYIKAISACVAQAHQDICNKHYGWSVERSDKCYAEVLATQVSVSRECLKSQIAQEQTMYKDSESFLETCRKDGRFLIEDVYYEDLIAGDANDQASVVRGMYNFLGVSSEICPFTPDMLTTNVQKQVVDYAKQIRDYESIEAEAKRLFEEEH